MSESSTYRVVESTFSPSYQEAWRMQEAAHTQVCEAAESGSDKKLAGQLLLGEHSHVFTIGKHGQLSNMLLREEEMRARGLTLVRIQRGGDITYHGPGQLVGYPILHLPTLRIGPRRYIEALEQTVIDTLAYWNLRGERISNAAGVWLPPSDHRPLRKICAIGVQITRRTTLHGFAFNVSTDLSMFSLINPCGFTDRGVTSLSEELGAHISVDEVRLRFVENFARILGVEVINRADLPQ